jgi:Fur family transcriptional regulator, ferric uptake regulator
MTIAHATPATAAPRLEDALNVLRESGLRVTIPRRLVLEALYRAERPVTVEELAARVRDADPASIYRNLEALESLGLVRHVHLGHGPGLYALVATSGDIEFVTCERCGAFEAVDPKRLDAVRDVIERELGYRARFTHFPIVGLCPDCSAGQNTKEVEPHAHP